MHFANVSRLWDLHSTNRAPSLILGGRERIFPAGPITPPAGIPAPPEETEASKATDWKAHDRITKS